VFVAVVGLASGARLDNAYLPPRGHSGSGAGGGFGGGAGGGFGGGAGGFGGGAFGGGPRGPFIPIISYTNNPNRGDGSYSYRIVKLISKCIPMLCCCSYETGNGIRAAESGHQTGPQSQAAQGSYSYTGPDGRTYTVTYTADERGFIPHGDHLPTPPPIPEAILKSLQINAAEEAAGGGSYGGGSYGGGSYHHGSGGFSAAGRPASFHPSTGYSYKK
ncbi:hypothetical protein AAG570_008440, partial [Ranatra chinensis]